MNLLLNPHAKHTSKSLHIRTKAQRRHSVSWRAPPLCCCQIFPAKSTARMVNIQKSFLLEPLAIVMASLHQGEFEHYLLISVQSSTRFPHPRPMEPNAYGDPYSGPLSIASTFTGGVNTAWRRHQSGVTRKVKLTNGNFIAEYPVPTPIHSSIEAKYAHTNTTEFS